jgi:hypothetical protein
VEDGLLELAAPAHDRHVVDGAKAPPEQGIELRADAHESALLLERGERACRAGVGEKRALLSSFIRSTVGVERSLATPDGGTRSWHPARGPASPFHAFHPLFWHFAESRDRQVAAVLRTANPSRNTLERKKLRRRFPSCQQIRHDARASALLELSRSSDLKSDAAFLSDDRKPA